MIWKSLQNDLIIKKHKKVSKILSYIEHSLVLLSEISGCVTTFAFTSLIGIPIGLVSFKLRLNICAITEPIKKYKWTTKKKKKKHDKIALIAKGYLNTIVVLISKDLMESRIIHDKIFQWLMYS